MTGSGRSIDFVYDEAGRELGRRLGHITLEHSFDALGRLTSQSVLGPAGRRAQHRRYTYRADGHLIGIEDQLSGTRRFDLDATGWVTAVHAVNWTETYAYDAAGNQTTASWPAGHPGQEAIGKREYTGTSLTRAGQVRYEHDGLGRITLRQKTRLSRKPNSWRYTWDAEDRLTSLSTPDDTRWRYSYDPLGRRTAKLRLAGDGETVAERVDFAWDRLGSLRADHHISRRHVLRQPKTIFDCRDFEGSAAGWTACYFDSGRLRGTTTPRAEPPPSPAWLTVGAALHMKRGRADCCMGSGTWVRYVAGALWLSKRHGWLTESELHSALLEWRFTPDSHEAFSRYLAFRTAQS